MPPQAPVYHQSKLRRVVRRPLLRTGGWFIDRLFNEHAIALALKRQHVLCLGDSHVRVMRHVRISRVWFRAKALNGATATGIMNPNSKTRSLVKFDELLQRAEPWQHVLLQLGEVDCGNVIWHRASRAGTDVEDQLDQTIDTYAAYIEKLGSLGFARIVVMSVPLPTIGDDPTQWGHIANRRQVTASQAERTRLTLRFNALLQENCDALRALFVDVTTGLLDPATGLIDRRFVRDTREDHHLADDPYAQLIADALGRLSYPPGELGSNSV